MYGDDQFLNGHQLWFNQKYYCISFLVELAEQTIANALNDADDESGKDNSGISRKVGDDRRLGDFMISTRIHQSWTKKFTNQFKYLQRKFNRKGVILKSY